MNNIIKTIALGCAAVCLLTACSSDDPEGESVINPSMASQTEFDRWLEANYVNPYNIRFVYRYEDNETDMDYFNVPAEYDKAVKLAHIVKYACIEAYDEVGGIRFTRAYFPKMLYATGDFEYRNDGSLILGTAEGGKKIFLSATNWLDVLGTTSVESLNTYYLKTIHHEFTHIMNQTTDYTADYQKVTGTGYVADNWTDHPYDGYDSDDDQLSGITNDYCYKHGFITAYSQYSHGEDFAEMLSEYVINTQEVWDERIARAGTEGAALINAKLDIVRSYMMDNFNIDIDKLRETVRRRELDVVAGRVDLMSLDVE